MVKVALLVLSFIVAAGVSRGEAAISPECLPTPLPSTPVSTIAPVITKNVEDFGDRMRIEVWRQPCLDGTSAPTLLKATPLSTAPFLCASDFDVIQGGAQFEARLHNGPTGSSGFCGDLLVPVTQLILPDGTPEFDDAAAYTLVYEGYVDSTTLFTFDVPAAAAPPLPVSLAGAAILPGSRAVQVGQPATAFASVVATGSGTATGCAFAPTNAPPGTTFSYQQTNAANVPIGTPNTPIDVPGGDFRTFVFTITPSQVFPATEIQFNFDCTNTNPAPVISGVSTFLLTSTAGPTPDIVALAAAVGGIVSIPGPTGIGAFVVATVNVGADALITITVDTGGVQLPLALSICQTHPTQGHCINPTTPGSSVTVQINHNDTHTFAIFGQGSENIPFSPGVNRINARFKTQTAGTVGSTSVAMRTQ